MNTIGVVIISLALGATSGALAGFSLVKDFARRTAQPAFKQVLFSLGRMIALGVISWRLLHWGPVAFILFGVSLLITMWFVIITFNARIS